MFLKEHHQVALHVACGDITDVALDGQNLIVRVENNMLAQLLGDGRRDIENALRWQGLDIGLKVEVLEKKLTPAEEDLQKLQPIVGDYLKIK